MGRCALLYTVLCSGTDLREETVVRCSVSPCCVGGGRTFCGIMVILSCCVCDSRNGTSDAYS